MKKIIKYWGLLICASMFVLVLPVHTVFADDRIDPKKSVVDLSSINEVNNGLTDFLSEERIPVQKAQRAATDYSYTVTPVLAPFNIYLFVKTDNPDVSNIRFMDKSTKYNSLGSGFELCKENFYDVVYENKNTYRVKGGYIFAPLQYCQSDGGKMTMQVKNSKNQYVDTSVIVNVSTLKTDTDYLIDKYTTSTMTFWQKLNAIQSALETISMYPKSLRDVSKPDDTTPYPALAASPYSELSLNEHYDMYHSYRAGVFAESLYPFVYDSCDFPSTMSIIAKKLDSSCTCKYGDYHYEIYVTLNGSCYSYGGAAYAGQTEPPHPDFESHSVR